MKYLIFLLLLSPIISYAQFFEGTFIYENSYESKMPGVKDEQLNSMMGTVHNYSIKEGNYKSKFNGTFLKTQLYNNAENRSYVLTSKSDSLYSEDYSKNKDVATNYTVEKKKATVLGVLCDVLTVYTPKTTTYYYYNNKYSLNSELYVKHQYGNWYYVTSKIKAVPLKIVYENDQFILTSTAVKITPEQLDNSMFLVVDKKKVSLLAL